MKTFSYVTSVILLVAIRVLAFGQAGFDDDRVMLQGFYWESGRHGYPDRFPYLGDKKWYVLVQEKATQIREGRFDLIWLPPPSHASGLSAGYNPKQYFQLDNAYGNFAQHRAMLRALLQQGVEPVADIVINHRDGTRDWADFTNPTWGLWAVCRNDELFEQATWSNTPDAERGAEEESVPYDSFGGTTYRYESFRDLDHTNRQVRKDILRYLLQLKSIGYRGWRYDMVHGFHARWIALYNKRSKPTFSVGEYEWDHHDAQRGWIWHTASVPDDLKTASAVFDFSTHFTLQDNKTNYVRWYGSGMIGDQTDGLSWKQKSVTFLENHDTGYRTEENGNAEKDHTSDSFLNNWEVEQAYAYILTHPGVPSVYWKHYFDWGSTLRNKIKALINARKVAGVHAGSTVHRQDNARDKGIYGAMIQGKKGALYVRVGGSDQDWQPSLSGYSDYREYAYGDGWKVWVKLPGNPAHQFAPLKAALPVPAYRTPTTIPIPDSWLEP
jgi:alpha-amylase